MNSPISRREFLKSSAAASAIGIAHFGRRSEAAEPDLSIGRHIYKSLKWDMIRHKGTTLDKFKLLKELGYDGVEIDSPIGVDKKEALEASRETGLPIDGIVNSTHWTIRHSDPDPAVRAQALKNMEKALRDAKFVGADSVLLVPEKVTNEKNENHDQVWERSIVEIRKIISVAEETGVRILIENVGNGFCTNPELMAKYIDEIHHPLVGVHFDIGNHIAFSPPANWIRVLGKRIRKLDVKDRTKDRKTTPIGEGDAGWPDVRKALAEIGYKGWAAAEVNGGERDRLREILDQMDRVLGKSDGDPKSLRG